MPFQSKSQIGKFRALIAQGKMSPKTLQEWLSETPSVKKLPERKKVAPKKG